MLAGLHARSVVGRAVALLAAAVAPSLALVPLDAGAQIAVVGSTVEEHVATPGESYSGSIVVRNMSAQAQPVRIYQTDYAFFSDGTSHFDSPATLPRSNARWVTLSTRSLIVPPGSDVAVAYTVAVPPGPGADSLRGTYWSVVMVEGEPKAPPPEDGKGQIGLGVVVRYAVQLATHIQTTGARRITFAQQQVSVAPDSTRSLSMSIENVGERGYRPLMWVEVYDSVGTLRASAKQQRGLLYPGTSTVQKFALGALPPGSYKAVVFADIGNDEVLASQYRLRF